jgi:hypothetical protein
VSHLNLLEKPNIESNAESLAPLSAQRYLSCAEQDQQLGGGTPLSLLMAAKGLSEAKQRRHR